MKITETGLGKIIETDVLILGAGQPHREQSDVVLDYTVKA